MIVPDPVRAAIPSESMINCELVITSYFDRDGQLRYATQIQGDPNLAQALGLCELAKHSIHASYIAENSDDDEEDDDDEQN